MLSQTCYIDGNPYSVYGLGGLDGLGLGASQAANASLAVGTSAATAASPLIATSLWGATSAAALPALAIPVVGAAIAGVSLAIGLFLNRKGPQQKVWSSKIVDQEEEYLKQNLAAWQSSSKTIADRDAALQNFNLIWYETKGKLGDPSLGEPGQRGIRDRDRGGKWDWWSYYYDPIANDPEVKPNPTIASNIMGVGGSVIESITNMGNMGMLAIGGILLLAGIASLGGKG